jgi:DNA-binding PadR family transcriptional regulator
MEPTLGEFEQLVLLALVRQGRDGYGMSIWQDMVDRSARDISLAAVYKTLERLEGKGLVASHVGDPTPERGGRRKKHYHLLASGQRALKASLATIRRMAEGLGTEFEL